MFKRIWSWLDVAGIRQAWLFVVGGYVFYYLRGLEDQDPTAFGWLDRHITNLGEITLGLFLFWLARRTLLPNRVRDIENEYLRIQASNYVTVGIAAIIACALFY